MAFNNSAMPQRLALPRHLSTKDESAGVRRKCPANSSREYAEQKIGYDAFANSSLNQQEFRFSKCTEPAVFYKSGPAPVAGEVSLSEACEGQNGKGHARSSVQVGPYAFQREMSFARIREGLGVGSMHESFVGNLTCEPKATRRVPRFASTYEHSLLGNQRLDRSR
jgi:hypothetical protein